MQTALSRWPGMTTARPTGDRLRAPVARPAGVTTVRDANARRNAQAPQERARGWTGTRDRLWAILDPIAASGASVAVVGAGNCDDVPLTRLVRRAARVDLIDVDPIAPRRAVRREPRRLRRRLRVRIEDVTLGAADRIVAAAHRGDAPIEMPAAEPVGAGGYDLLIGDLLYSQLLFPALLDSGVPADRRGEVLTRYGPALTEAVVRRLHASAPRGPVVHLHDFAGWWDSNTQPVRIERVLEDPVDVALSRPLTSPLGCDPRDGLRRMNAEVVQTDVWRWPFGGGVDYAVCATVAVDRTPRL